MTLGDPRTIGLYIHVPYCRSLCPYCDFLRQPIPGQVPDSFIHALCTEILDFEDSIRACDVTSRQEGLRSRHCEEARSDAPPKHSRSCRKITAKEEIASSKTPRNDAQGQAPDQADSVFLGGGTPSLLSTESLERILDTVRGRFALVEPEVTIEANPDDVTPALLDEWKSCGVNRVSLGVQGFDDEVLRYLGRRHDAATARRACAWVAERFENWSMDLIFGARPLEAARPYEVWRATLEESARFAPPHVSAYGLTYEPSTPFGSRAHEAVDEDAYIELYWLADEHLPGLERYEVSNLARSGFECRHNLRYWHNEEYAGFGPGAFSFIEGVRARNTRDVAQYVRNPGAKEEELRLTEREIRTETAIQHLRLKAGLPTAHYARRFGRSPREDFGAQLDGLASRGLIEEAADAFRPTRKGFELNNEIGLALVD